MLCLWFSQLCGRQEMHDEIENPILLIFRRCAPEPPIFITICFAAICNTMVNHGITQSILLSVFVGRANCWREARVSGACLTHRPSPWFLAVTYLSPIRTYVYLCTFWCTLSGLWLLEWWRFVAGTCVARRWLTPMAAPTRYVGASQNLTRLHFWLDSNWRPCLTPTSVSTYVALGRC